MLSHLLYIALGLLVVVAVVFWQVRRRAQNGRFPLPPPDHSSSLAPTEEPEAPPTPLATLDAWRVPLTIWAIGGLMLILFGQVVYPALIPKQRLWLYGPMGIGAALFFLSGLMISWKTPFMGLFTSLDKGAAYFGISVGQFSLLLMAPLYALLTRFAAGDSLLAVKPWLATVAWLVAVLFVMAGSYKKGQETAVSLTRWEIYGIAGLFIAAFFLRGAGLAQFPTTLSGDEASAGIASLMFLDGTANNLFGLGWFSFPSLYFAVQAVGIGILGQTIEGLRIMAALAGALTVVGLYGLVRSLFGRITAVFAAAYLLVSHFHIHFSRIGLNNVWDGFFLVLILGGTWHGWKTGSRRSFIIAGFALGLSQYFYVSSRIFPILLLLWAAAALFSQPTTFKQRFPDFVLASWIALVVALPILLFFASHPAEFTAPMQRVTIFGPWLEMEIANSGRSATQIVLDQMRLTALGITHEPLRHWYNPGAPLLLAGPAALFLLGVGWAILSFDLRYWLITLPVLGLIVLGGTSQDAPASQRFVGIVPMVAVFVAVPLGQLVEWLQTMWPKYRPFAILPVACLMGWFMFLDLHYYFFEVYDSYVLGGLNTLVASEVADFLQEQENPAQSVYFFGFPRMGYYSISTIPYLNPLMSGIEVDPPLTGPPAWDAPSGDLMFIFLPERLSELEWVRQVYENGRYQEFHDANGQTLFAVYDTPPPTGE